MALLLMENAVMSPLDITSLHIGAVSCGYAVELWICSRVVDMQSSCGYAVKLWICSQVVDMQSSCGYAVKLWICSRVVDMQSSYR